MNKKWNILSFSEEEHQNLTSQLSTNPILTKILIQRDIKDFDSAKKFFRPDISELYDPFLMKDMQRAVNRIVKAIENDERILFYGDYDVDGTTSVALLMLFFRDLHDKIEFYIPNRYSEGYGLSEKGVQYAIDEKIDLVITIDCGISSVDLIQKGQNNGVDFIICDHHIPGEIIPPAVAILNPKQKDCKYPFDELSGCGVGFKLCQALSNTLGIPDEKYLDLIDLVAVSIACDIVPVVDENRILAKYGLDKFNHNPSVGLSILKNISDIENTDLLISDLVFKIGPKINAPGRVAHAKTSVEILSSNDFQNGMKIAKKIAVLNDQRKEMDSNTTSEANIQIEDKIPQSSSSIIVSDDTWSKGVVGIVASRLVERYYKPAIVFAEKDNMLTGSARSIKGFNIYEGIKKCSEYLSQFGGHEYAAGLSMPKENLKEFKDKFEKIAEAEISEEMKFPTIDINAEISLSDITMSFYNLIMQMAPFGPQNMTPVFVTYNLRDTGNSKLVGMKKNHLKLEMMDDDGKKIKGILFNVSDSFDIKKLKSNTFDICYSINLSTFRNQKSLEVMVKDLKIST